MSKKGEWVSITDAARRLSAAGDPIDRSTLSRYLKQHAESLPVRQEGKSKLVDFDAVKAHRAENIRIETRTETPSTRSPDEPAPLTGPARKALAEAEIKEMELARLRGHLVPVQEVDEGARDAIALMQSAFDRAIDGEAATLSVKYGWDERAVRLALKAFARTGTDVFHREMLKRLDGLGTRGAENPRDRAADPEAGLRLQ